MKTVRKSSRNLDEILNINSDNMMNAERGPDGRLKTVKSKDMVNVRPTRKTSLAALMSI